MVDGTKFMNEDNQKDLQQEESTTAKEINTTNPAEAKQESTADATSDTIVKNEQESVIPELDYTALSMDELTDALRTLIQDFPIQDIKDHVESIKKAFETKDAAQEKEQKASFTASLEIEEGEEKPEFEYDDRQRMRFNELVSLYRKQRGAYQREQRKQQEENLAKRKSIIEQIKNLINEEENIGTTFKKFHELQDQWKTIGKISHDAYNITWNDYRLHVQNFYDYIDLSKELRDIDFERNLEFLNRIIARAEELANEPNVHKALRELQELHRMWKEDVGPVAKEQREPTWQRFKAASDVIHDKRQAYYEQRDEMAEKNKTIKENIVAEILKITKAGAKNHKGWQDRLEEVNALKELFSQTGPAPKEVNNKLWDEFRAAGRAFNQAKNSFYKDIQKEQKSNLDKKMALIAIAEEHQNSENIRESLEVMKRIQREWKEIGHVPRKVSDKIWKRFQAACNAFFEKMNNQKKEESAEEAQNFKSKTEIYDTLKNLIIADDEQKAQKEVIAIVEQWNSLGKVPYVKRHIQEKFDKLVKAKLKAAGMNTTDAEMLKYASKLASLKSGDERAFRNERSYLRKRKDEITAEITQLENNLQFVNSKDEKNPFTVQIKKSMQSLNEELDLIAEKQKQLNILQRQLQKEEEPSNEEVTVAEKSAEN